MMKWDAEYVQQMLDTKRVVLRVSDETSMSPRFADGFTATDPKFDGLTLSQFHRRYQHLCYFTGWKWDEERSEEMVNHILGGWTNWSSFGRTVISPYISTSASLDWSVWEIARRLARLNTPKISLSVIRSSKARTYRGHKLVMLGCERRLERFWEENDDDSDDNVKSAMRFAKNSKEILVYGRIFDRDIEQVTAWTANAPGMALPAEHRKAPRYRRSGTSWLKNLAWDPYSDTFPEAAQKIALRREEVERSRR